MSGRNFMVFYRPRDGAEYETPNHFVAVDPFGAATEALGKLARPNSYVALAVLDESTHSIHLYNIVTYKPELVPA